MSLNEDALNAYQNLPRLDLQQDDLSEVMVLEMEPDQTVQVFSFKHAATAQVKLTDREWRQVVGLSFLVDLSRTSVEITPDGVTVGRLRESPIPMSRVGRYPSANDQ